MKNGSVDELERPNGRFVRNLALSLSGGALITLLGATAAHADDAGTQSEGAGAAHSGDATAVGNRSGTDATQTGTVSGGLGSIQVTNQSAVVPNTGIAVANTGGNVAVGNSSNNTNTVNQTGDSNLGPAVNQGSAANSSNGSASIWTGDASAVGNQSQTSLNQSSNAQGTLGGILIVGQNQLVSNSGVALANSGGNTATGNDSTNDGTLTQIANAAAGLATNTGSSRNDSDGKATISTGNASAVGNQSDSKVTQSSNGAAGGASGGLEVIEQDALVANLGGAVANSGGNTATGNESTSTNVNNIQSIPAATPSITGVANNSADVANTSDGSADIWTGAATAMGNTSSTDLTQSTDDSTGDDGGGAIVTQASSVLNAGLGIANSGLNTATGNASTNTVLAAAQDIDDGANPLLAVANQTLSGGNTSDGTASISTGPSWASGNESDSDVSQTSESTGGTLNLLPQVSGVQNLGAAVAESGGNDATGNASTNQAQAIQTTAIGAGATVTSPVVINNQAEVQSTSDGSATIATGAAKATGNHSSSELSQDLDPAGLILPTQVADVLNVGIGIAESGGNSATGSATGVGSNLAAVAQATQLGGASPGTFLAGQTILSNSASISNDVDGSASITTGAATATGNHSATDLDQAGDNHVDGLGLIVGTQAAAVANVGLADASTGGNVAVGNASTNQASLPLQRARVGLANPGATTVAAGTILVSNQADAGNTSDGSASITTGAASAWGNDSTTDLSQDESGTVDGLGVNLETQVALPINLGIGVANSGGNIAIGNASTNVTNPQQDTAVGSDNAGPTTILAGQVLATNSASVQNDSDGSASITTGDAAAWGNSSTTDIAQETAGSVSGMGLTLDTQAAAVLNGGLGLANSGGNVAVGNVSTSTSNASQSAQVGVSDPGGVTLLAAGALGSTSSLDQANRSDGDASVATGAASAHGNQSHTTIGQDPDSAVDGMGTVIGTQVAGVANVGVGVANSGLNAAVGNASGRATTPNTAVLTQTNSIASADPTAVAITALGPVLASNSGSIDNSSDGSAKVGTGAATADGNTSSTTVDQSLGGSAAGGGVVLGTQAGGVANVGLGVANSGLNAAVGNASTNTASTTQTSLISSDPNPASFTALGPVVGSTQGHADNASDGEACVCTGNAAASGNVSQTMLDQDLDQSTGGGLVLLTESGGVLNAGLGLANSGANLAVGNISTNTATAQQASTINDALLTTPITTSQVANVGGGTANTSDGAGLVGTGSATGTGNQSTTNFAQAADVDSSLSVSAVNGGTANVGLGLANAGLNLGVGNASTNSATLIQAADGSGIVSSQGEATNDSDGTATVGNPDCDTPGETPPGETGLPRTGGPIAVELAAALTLLFLGFGIRRTAQRLS